MAPALRSFAARETSKINFREGRLFRLLQQIKGNCSSELRRSDERALLTTELTCQSEPTCLAPKPDHLSGNARKIRCDNLWLG
jgi:hypothetical protein